MTFGKAHVGLRREWLGSLFWLLYIDSLIGLIDEEQSAMVDGKSTAPVFLSACPGAVVGGSPVSDLPIGSLMHDHGSALLGRTRFDPVEASLVKVQVAKAYALSSHEVGMDGGRPRTKWRGCGCRHDRLRAWAG